ncbi:hypothetical protein [uncultured Desulfovibrio sp.]|uniref:hypothetical protein n=1 Tax=uncultured Desulfovibrio sp. TaxID=167968 RepID=UPI00262522E3|nr:hypothetical protein [uncultured Desulfovibrio sp.]
MDGDAYAEELMPRERRQAEDMAALLRRPEGRRVLMEMLRRWGAGLPVGGTEAERALRNEAELLLGRIMRASPRTGAEMLVELYGGER